MHVQDRVRYMVLPPRFPNSIHPVYQFCAKHAANGPAQTYPVGRTAKEHQIVKYEHLKPTSLLHTELDHTAEARAKGIILEMNVYWWYN